MLAATTCLPFISPHVRHIDGVGSGLFFDGALVNYHLNIRPAPAFRALLLADGPGPQFKQVLRSTAPARSLLTLFLPVNSPTLLDDPAADPVGCIRAVPLRPSRVPASCVGGVSDAGLRRRSAFEKASRHVSTLVPPCAHLDLQNIISSLMMGKYFNVG